MLKVLIESFDGFEQLYSGHLSPNYSQSKAGDSFSIHFHLQYTPMAAILKNGCNFGTNSARCMFIDLIECSHDFQQLLFQAFFFYLFTKQGQEQFFIYNMRLWRPFSKMAAMAARGRIHDGPISKFVHNRLDYLCAKFGAFIKKCTISLNIQGKQPRYTEVSKTNRLYTMVQYSHRPSSLHTLITSFVEIFT